LYQIIGYTYSSGSTVNLKGAGTFKLPDFRGRFPLGVDNMNNNITVPSVGNSQTSISTVSATAGRVSDITAANIGAGSDNTAIGSGPGSTSVTLTTSQLPQHTHNLKSASNTQYYAVGDTSSSSDSDTTTVTAHGITPSGSNRGATNAGPVLNSTTGSTTTGQPISIMNPYLAINYIIYTGVGA
jgi:microcystin-dependent protein